MIRLSVNVNKVATLRNARAGALPDVSEAVAVCLDAGAPGITVHPRADERHITRRDVTAIADQLGTPRRRPALPASAGEDIEFNIEGDPRADFVDLVVAARPHQCTLVPVLPGEVTSQAGWPASTSPERLTAVIARLHAEGIRVSLFVDPEEAPIRWAKRLGADRIELYTEPFATACASGRDAGRASRRAASKGGVPLQDADERAQGEAGDELAGAGRGVGGEGGAGGTQVAGRALAGLSRAEQQPALSSRGPEPAMSSRQNPRKRI